MSWEVTLAVLAAAVVHAGWNAMVKRGGDPLFETALIHGWVALPAAIALPWLPPPGPVAAACLVASTAVHCLYYHALAAAYRHGDLSLAYPVMRGSAPMLTALLAGIALGEWPGAWGWAGIAAVCGGVLAIGLARARGVDPAARRRSIGWALLTAATIVAYTLIDSHGARHAPSAWSYVAWLAAVEGAAIAAIVLARHGRPFVDYARARGASPMAAGVAAVGGYGVALWAMTLAPIALVAALRETSVLFALVIARLALGERFGPLRWAGAASILAGIALLRLA
ncbi:MAG TPA: EamA family transporter [Burkholderiaceae bacterium]|nr:EamA family transporter [Burkholderiaceae bacterium]